MVKYFLTNKIQVILVRRAFAPEESKWGFFTETPLLFMYVKCDILKKGGPWSHSCSCHYDTMIMLLRTYGIYSLSKMAILSSFQSQSSNHPCAVWSTCGQPQVLSLSKEDYKDLVYSPVLHSSTVISSAFSGDFFQVTTAFLLLKSSLMKLNRLYFQVSMHGIELHKIKWRINVPWKYWWLFLVKEHRTNQKFGA